MSSEIRIRVGERKLDGVMYEVAQEKAAALSRMGRRLDDALQALRAFDAVESTGGAAGGAPPTARADLVAEAAEALWYYVVQREACGLRDSEWVMDELGVPREVQVRMGLRRR